MLIKYFLYCTRAQLKLLSRVGKVFSCPPASLIKVFPAPSIFILIAISLLGCNGSSDEEDSGSSSSNRFSLSGRIQVASNTAKDDDVNDIKTEVVPNDSVYTAQRIPNPVILGGYVNEPGTGSSGHFKTFGDTEDFFEVELQAGQTITLFVANQNLFGNDLDLGLLKLNSDGTTSMIDASVGYGDTETLTVPANGRYFVQVQAHLGASNYVLSIGQNLSATSHGMRLSDDFVPGEVIAQLSPDSAVSALSLKSELKNPVTSRSQLFSVNLNQVRTSAADKMTFATPELRSKYETLKTIKQLHINPDILEAVPNYRVYAFREPNDKLYDHQWNLTVMNLPQAWDITIGDPSVIVAVVDTGVLFEHPDLRGNLIQGYDFIDNILYSLDGDGRDPDANDPGDQLPGGSSFHGTHVAGTVAAMSNNSEGVAGISWLTKIMPLRVLGQGGVGTVYDVEQALRYAAGLPNDSGTVPAQSADVINFSLGGPGVYAGFQQLMADIYNAGVMVVAAAGNENTDAPSYPAALDGVISVGAVDILKRRASYSNYGPYIDVVAPGGDSSTPDINGDGLPDSILSTIGDETGSGSGKQKIEYTFDTSAGTSMSAPHVAGVISLMKAVNPALTPSDFDNLLKSGKITDDLGYTGRDDDFGYGLINAQKAVSAAIELGGGVAPQPAPLLVVNPRSLNFGLNRTSATLTLSNGGNGDLYIENIRDDSGGFLSWQGNGLGDYIIRVDRSRLNTGTLTATLTITSNINTVQIPVILQVGDPSITGNAGRHYILLVNPDTLRTVGETQATVNNGYYYFRFNNIPRGKYIIVAGSDFNNDGFICEGGEACGAFSTLDRPSTLEITGSRSGIDFSTGFNVNFMSQAFTAEGTDQPRGFARLQPQHQFAQ